MCDTYWTLLQHSVMTWTSSLSVPWFVAGTGIGVPVGIAVGSSLSSHVYGFTLVTTATGLLGGVAADFLSTSVLSHLEHSLTVYDVLTTGAGPACLLLVVLSRGLRSDPSVAVRPVAAFALAALLLEPLFSAYVVGNAAGVGVPAAATARASFQGFARKFLRRFGNRAGRAAPAGTPTPAVIAAFAAASAVSRARWLTAGAQLVLWTAVVVAYARLSLQRLSGWNAGRHRRDARSYMAALGVLASKKRGSGGWVRAAHLARGGAALAGSALVPRGVGGAPAGYQHHQSRARTSSLLGSLYERFARGGPGGDSTVLPSLADASGPLFERGEVTVRGIRCAGLDATITGRPAAAFEHDPNAGVAGGHGGGGDGDGGGGGRDGVDGRKSRPFYVTVTLGSVTARTSVRPGFAPSFTEVFPLGCDCPIRGAFLVIAVVDSFETGRSGRGDRIVGEVHLPLEAAQLVPGTPSADDARPGYRLSGDWELQGLLGAVGDGATVGADVTVRGPPSPTSAAGRLRRRRESVGWYAR